MKSKQVFILYVTNRCNLNCKYCFVEKGNDVLDFETYKNLFEENKDKIGSFVFFGGEPLLEFELIKRIIDYNESKGYFYNYSINTNGTLINDEVLDYCKNKCISLSISFDGNEKSNAENRFNKAVFIKVKKNLKLVIENRIDYVINYVISPNNVSFLSESLEYFLKNGFLRVSLMMNFDAKWSAKDIKSLKDQIDYITNIIIKPYKGKYLSLHPVIEKFNLIIEGKTAHKCMFGEENLVIYCDGKKYPCSAFVKNKRYEIKSDNHKFKNICNIKECKECRYEQICNNKCMCSYMATNASSMYDMNCEFEKFCIRIAEKEINIMFR